MLTTRIRIYAGNDTYFSTPQ